MFIEYESHTNPPTVGGLLVGGLLVGATSLDYGHHRVIILFVVSSEIWSRRRASHRVTADVTNNEAANDTATGSPLESETKTERSVEVEEVS